jgi:hypothetical protein
VVLAWRGFVFVGALVLAFLFAGLMEQPADAWWAYIAGDVMLSLGAILPVGRAGSRAVTAHLMLATAWNLGAFFLASLSV